MLDDRPGHAAAHTVKAAYTGGTYYLASDGAATFALTQRGVSLPTTASAGSVTVGKAGSPTRVTFTSSGTGAVAVASVAVTGTEFAVTGDTCSGTTVAAGSACTVGVGFKPSAAGARTATLSFADNADGAPHTVALTGTGVAPVGATFTAGSATTRTATASGAFTVPVSCPVGETCAVDGVVTITSSLFAESASAAKAATATVARFTRVKIKSGKVESVTLKLSPAFVHKAQKHGVRSVKATLTINTTFGGGTKLTTRQAITVRLPKAPAAPEVAPKFTG